jgi:hypothetical protein
MAENRYRKIEVRMWGDEKFRTLSPMPPSGQGLWLFLLTGPHTGPIPGLFRAGRAALAEELGWTQEAFEKAFEEVFRLGIAKADWGARVVWIPNAIKCNLPQSPNVITSWAGEWRLIPECSLKAEAYMTIESVLCESGEAFRKAFDKACRKPSVKPMPNQEQEQEQEQEEKPSAADATVVDDSDPIDPRHAPVRALIQESHLKKFRVKCQWDGSEGKTLDRLLSANPSWTEGQISQMVRNRFESEDIASDRPRKWLPNIGSYAAGAQDRFNKLKGVHSNGNGNGSRAERRQAANLAARETARAAVMAD